jgi:hypothetical protein
MEGLSVNLETLPSMDPVVTHEFDVDLGCGRNLNAACSAFEVKIGYLTLKFVALKGVQYPDLSGKIIGIKAVNTNDGSEVVVLAYRLTKLKAVLTKGDATGYTFGPNVMTFEQRYTYTFEGIQSK